MSQFRLLTLTSADELLNRAAAWDDLWRRSQVALPTLQAEPIALWLRQFAPGGGFRGFVVEKSGCFVAARRLEELGTLELKSWIDATDASPLAAQDSPLALEAAVYRAFELENQTWKGDEGTSVLRTPGMLDYFVRQAELMARRGQLALHFLELDGQPIAFELGYFAKGTYFAHKGSYLPSHQ